MTSKLNRFSVAVLVGTLVTACGGEELPQTEAMTASATVEQGLDTFVIEYTGAGESVTCEDGTVHRYPSGALWSCTIRANFQHQYRTIGGVAQYVTYAPYSGGVFTESGLKKTGTLAFDHTLYVGAGNGMLTFKSGTGVSMTATNFQDGVIYYGTLAQNTCLKSSSGTGYLCGTAHPTSFETTGYLYSCPIIGYCTP